jgi:hypothetical protein
VGSNPPGRTTQFDLFDKSSVRASSLSHHSPSVRLIIRVADRVAGVRVADRVASQAWSGRSQDSKPMNVQEAIQAAEHVLPGQAAPEGSDDPCWQCNSAIREFLESAPDAVWEFIKRWGVHEDDDLRWRSQRVCWSISWRSTSRRSSRAFRSWFVRNRLFASTFRSCWKFAQSEAPANSVRDALKREAQETH